MKEYKDKIPAIVVGGVAGSFLGEYQAGGVIVVLGFTGRTSRSRAISAEQDARQENLPEAIPCRRHVPPGEGGGRRP